MDPAPSAAHEYPPDALLTALLRDVSRSFYLTLRVLPKAIRPQISLAYLLARAADTIADTALVPASDRLATLEALRERILGRARRPLELRNLAGQQGTVAERVLLERVEAALELLDQFSASDQQHIREVLATITLGQVLDLQRFGRADAQQVAALETAEELDDYTYRVAGCVGEFWTRMCRAHLFPRAPLNDAVLTANGIRFGKGLQLINILRDLPGDLRRGRCYLPAQQLAAQGLKPADLANPANQDRLRPVYNQWLAQAENHLAAGWDYTNMLPRSCVRVRLACAWPILMGARTAARLRQGNVLDARTPIKISRREVRRVIVSSLLSYPFQNAWRRQFERSLHGRA